jgi:hypothetical protein
MSRYTLWAKRRDQIKLCILPTECTCVLVRIVRFKEVGQKLIVATVLQYYLGLRFINRKGYPNITLRIHHGPKRRTAYSLFRTIRQFDLLPSWGDRLASCWKKGYEFFILQFVSIIVIETRTFWLQCQYQSPEDEIKSNSQNVLCINILQTVNNA